MKIWVDDIRPAPDGYDVWFKTVNETVKFVSDLAKKYEFESDFIDAIELIDLDHDAGVYCRYGGDYINILNFFEREKFRLPIRIHSMNVVGRLNMLAICERNGWVVVL